MTALVVLFGLLAVSNVITWAFVGGWGKRLERQIRALEQRPDQRHQ